MVTYKKPQPILLDEGSEYEKECKEANEFERQEQEKSDKLESMDDSELMDMDTTTLLQVATLCSFDKFMYTSATRAAACRFLLIREHLEGSRIAGGEWSLKEVARMMKDDSILANLILEGLCNYIAQRIARATATDEKEVQQLFKRLIACKDEDSYSKVTREIKTKFPPASKWYSKIVGFINLISRIFKELVWFKSGDGNNEEKNLDKITNEDKLRTILGFVR